MVLERAVGHDFDKTGGEHPVDGGVSIAGARIGTETFRNQGLDDLAWRGGSVVDRAVEVGPGIGQTGGVVEQLPHCDPINPWICHGELTELLRHPTVKTNSASLSQF